MAQHNESGHIGEEEAVRFLELKGFEIWETNWRYHPYEIDILARDGDYLVVVEVKTRSTQEWEHPKEAIGRSKISFLSKAVEAYINLHQIELEVRFDVVSIIRHGDAFEIEHLQEAFHPEVNR
ncbi:putative endonuclease [Breznakibacter xylanolyticus]|uniref:UPF0102 protein LX69_03194 n=1 Tax=Breznakibacter xylanolyticus TaxID=990 RepID=A0A2W7PPH0_9BACT|nr:YraN family protein [Breznakibacter xylanolyticus]PZX11239.1 putative endonuclease [Breznakibacter xylanolyticus]